MERKAGGAVAIGTLVVALGYFASDRGPSPSASPPAATREIQGLLDAPGAAGGDAQVGDFSTVAVFYATDRQVVQSPTARDATLFARIGLIGGAAFAMFAAWFGLRGRRTAAMTTGLVGGVLGVTLILGSRWLSQLGRSESEMTANACRYGPDRGTLEVGVCEVTIPRSHQMGEVERPSILKLELHARSDRHVILQSTIPSEHDAFFAEVRARVQAAPQRDAFVFVHGFNVSFEAAARRTAQMAHDLNYRGAPIFYSWPSQATTWGYTVDETNVAWSVPHLKAFLRDLIRESQADSIHLVAHSMGTRALTQAVRELGSECPDELRSVRQVVLAAPDIDADVFREQIAPALVRSIPQVTLYSSPSDEALAASKLVHGSRRAGESSATPLVVPGVETVDVAVGGLGLLGHSYYGSNPRILRDLAAVLFESRPAARRPWLKSFGDEAQCFWRFAETTETAVESRDEGDVRR